MASFVGDLWKKVGELKFSAKPGTSFPFVFDEQRPVGTVGPFVMFHGQDFESSERREESIFRRVTVFSCKERNKLEGARRILKSLKTMRHPRMLRYISSKESESEVLMVTECVEPFGSVKESAADWQVWGKWSVTQVYQFLKEATGREICIDGDSGNLWVTLAGEVKIALFSESTAIEDFSLAIKRNFPAASDHAESNVLCQLTETFDLLVTLSAGERVNLIKKLSGAPQNFLKFIALPELIKSRKLMTAGSSEISMEEVLFLFVKGKELLEGSVDDFMFLMSDFYCDLLGKHATGQPVPLTICLLDQMGGIWVLFTEKYAQDKVYPHVSVLLGHPLPAVREAALKALQGLCEKLSVKTIGNDVLRQLARLQGDAEGLLRLKALGVLEESVWPKIPDALKAKICGPAVSRALADSYAPCRRAGLNLLRRGITLLPPQEIVTKLVPAVAGLLIEADAGIRTEAFECMEKLILPTLKRSNEGAKVSAVSTPPTVVSNTAPITDKSTSMRSSSLPASTSPKINSPAPVAAPVPDDLATFEKPPVKTSQTTSGSKMKLGSIKKIV